MLVIFKIKRQGEVSLVKAFIKDKKVVITKEDYEPEDFPEDVKFMQHDKDVIVVGDTSNLAKGRKEYTTEISVLKRWKELEHFADMPLKKYNGYRGRPTNPLQALKRTRVVWEYLSKYGGDKEDAHRTLEMPSEKQNCTLCEYVQLNCSEFIGPSCREFCPVDWGRFVDMKEDEPSLLCYQSGSPFYKYVNSQNEESSNTAKGVLYLIDLTINDLVDSTTKDT